MKTNVTRTLVVLVLATMLLPATAVGQGWQVVANNGDVVPDDSRTFNSYNPPSVNVTDLVVFRARSRGGMMGAGGEPAHGVYVRDMLSPNAPIGIVFDRDTTVPDPNNVDTPVATFIEPPAFPRIDIFGDTIVSRAVHSPVWAYDETRAGTTGIYTLLNEQLITGFSNLGQVPEFDFFSVPEHPRTKFDVFPGAPSVTEDTIVFKGNYVLYDENGVAISSHTGVYYRELLSAPIGGDSPAVLIANNEDTLIPGTDTLFGSTAPPSAAVATETRFKGQKLAVFAGFDNEENPTLGGIYLATLGESRPLLVPLVEIGSQVPGERRTARFNRLGEGVSFDGRFVAFWGAWGSEVKQLTLLCPEDGNRDRIAFCQQLYPNGFDTTVPLNQGIFVHDIVTGRTTAVAKTPNDFDDFVYWNFSGRVPGADDEEDGEPARWRSAAFVAVSGLVDGRHQDAGFHVAFKARTGMVQAEQPNVYADPTDGIYLKSGPGRRTLVTLVETGMDGTILDPEAVDPEAIESESALPVTSMAIERDGFRGNSLAITVSMGTEEAGWAGVYLTKIQEPSPVPRIPRVLSVVVSFVSEFLQIDLPSWLPIAPPETAPISNPQGSIVDLFANLANPFGW